MEVNKYKSNSLLDKKGIDNFTKKGFLREGGGFCSRLLL